MARSLSPPVQSLYELLTLQPLYHGKRNTMNQANILISVVIPTYNYAQTLRRAVMSVAPQLTHKHELIVIDDGSTDDTPLVVQDLERTTCPDRIRFIRKENGGLSSVRNRGIREAQGSFLIFLDADDELMPHALDKFETHILDHPETHMVIGGHISVLPNGKKKEHLPTELPSTPMDRLRAYLLNKQLILCNGACAMHKAIFMRGDYPESFRSAEDIPVFAQALSNEPCTLLHEAIALIHKHDDSLRHQFSFAKAGGLHLVDEVFSTARQNPEYQVLKQAYLVQRCLSLFRSAYLAQDDASAKEYYCRAVQNDWRVLFKLAYSKKAIRLWLR